MRISDWSSDVCSSDLLVLNNREAARVMLADALAGKELRTDQPLYRLLMVSLQQFTQTGNARPDMDLEVLSFTLLGSIASIIMLSYQHEGDVDEIGRESGREGECQYV